MQENIFDQLLGHMEHYSIATLMISLLGLQIDEYLFEDLDSDQEEICENESMQELFYQQKRTVVRKLIVCLSKDNKDDLEKTMNASMIL